MTMARGARKAKSLPYASAFFKQWKSQKKRKRRRRRRRRRRRTTTATARHKNNYKTSSIKALLFVGSSESGWHQGAPWELELRFVFFVGIVLRAVSQAIKRNITAMRTSPKRTEERRRKVGAERDGGTEGWRTKLSREETSANWVRWDRLSSCRVEVPHPLLLLVRYVFFLYVTPTPPTPPVPPSIPLL